MASFHPKMEKCEYTTERVYKEIWEDIIKGVFRMDIHKKLMNGEYSNKHKYCSKTAYKMINDVRLLMKKEWEDRKEDLKDEQYTRMQELYKICLEKNDRATALNIIKEFNKCTGISDNTQKVDMNLTGDINISFNLE